MDKKRLLLISTGILAAALIFMGYQIKIPYKQQISGQQGITNTISVAGEGKSYVTPDTLTINISVSELGKTTKEAQTMTNEKITKVKELLKTSNIAKENIKTINVNVYPEYDRSNNNQRKLLGYRSQQSLSIDIQGENFGQKGADLIEKIGDIGNIQIDSTNFSIKEKAKAMEDARKNAFNDAKEKATQLADLGGVNLGKPTMITDQEVNYYPTPMYAMEAKGAGASDANTAPLSPGQQEVTVRINVTYEIK